MSESAVTYEALRDFVRAVLPAIDAKQRKVQWLEPSRSLAVARDHVGRVELFLLGPALLPHSQRIRDRIVYDTWLSPDGSPVPANRLVLSPGPEYDAATALICVELLDQGYSEEPATGFARAEPVIDLILTQAAHENVLITGLAGELQLLAAMIQTADDAAAAHLIDAWQGWDRSSRDFQFGPVGVEVKTTTIGASVHDVQGWYQVELGVAADGQAETHLHLLSLGIQWLDHDSNRGVSIESLVQSILSSLSTDRHQDFVTKVRGFAGGQLAVNPDGTAGSASLRRPFMAVFERLYDLTDEAVLLPSSVDFAQFTHLQIDSVKFRAQFPEKVRGDLNPVAGMQAVTRTLLAQMRR